ncbi:hypothetical protein [Aureibacter tunicatorum]|uniref:Uncharacterized protein n=1 Tax=Aureibacter tunicatorum TaxID=866807 RepID=A0AAE3XQ49_9BACT|nr:hypothetical protein [Aureibacter tunicatorum]MDR6240000.1 hypothetical protein [Aureibacter tunicatorum]BDD04472.1 hypothetical protein AUTU_19550 [Aureibacter tunicatorum]
MKKFDKTIHNIVLAAIKRKTLKPYEFRWTNLYESNSEFPYVGMLKFSEEELLICSTVIDEDNYSILTTRSLITSERGVRAVNDLTGVKQINSDNFKSFGNNAFTMGVVSFLNGSQIKYFIETGNASMVMIYGVMTLFSLQNANK